MMRLVSSLLLATSALLVGCSEPEEPYVDSIPEIPPGRSVDGGPTGQPPAPPGEK